MAKQYENRTEGKIDISGDGLTLAEVEEAKREAIAKDSAAFDKREEEQGDPFPQAAYQTAREAIAPVREALARTRNWAQGASAAVLERQALAALPDDATPGMKTAAKAMAAEFDRSGNLARVEQMVREHSIDIANANPELTGQAADPNRPDESIDDIVAKVGRA